MKKGDLIIIITSILLIVGIFVGYKLYINSLGNERKVEIRYMGKVIYEIELTDEVDMELLIVDGKRVAEINRKINPNAKFDLSNLKDYNVVKIYNNGIRVIEADCASQDDVRRGFTNRPFDIIICLPHALEVEIRIPKTNNNGPDGVVE